MVFWGIATLLTLVACMAVLVPFLRAEPNSDQGAGHDIEVYRDQLGELERDAQRGIIAPSEAEGARAEIGRRILKAEAATAAPDRPKARGTVAKAVVTAAVLIVPLVSWGLYSDIGSPGEPDQRLLARLQRDPAENSLDELVVKAEAHLAANPDDKRGWQVLAPIYVRMARYTDAQTAYRNAIRLNGATAELESGLGETIAAAAGGTVTTDAQAAFNRALALDAADAKARYYLATGFAQEGRDAEAAKIWQAMMAQLPEDSPWRGAARQALAKLDDGGLFTPGPDQQDIAAAAELPTRDRLAMIEGMVARLDARLEENPDDAEGWRRLVRSYVVLGQTDAAKDALSRGMAAMTDDQSSANELRDFAASLGIEMRDRQ